MDRVSQEELISAYFDGMVTAEEREHAERLLQASTAARAWLAQLKTMQPRLQDLPRQKMPTDCTAAVLRKAEQEMLLAGAGPLAHEPVVAPYRAQGLPAETHVRIWIALCVAAVALIVVVLPQYFQQRGPAGPLRCKMPRRNRLR